MSNKIVLEERFQKEISEIYSTYVNVIKPYVAQYEVITEEFPTEILNEVRAIFAHISLCYEFDIEKEIESHITKAKGHLKRCILDCYKYLCLAFDDKFKSFLLLTKYQDLSVVDNGEFLPGITKERKECLHNLRSAKLAEIGLAEEVKSEAKKAAKQNETTIKQEYIRIGDNWSQKDEKVYELFEKAYNSYKSLDEKIDDSHEKVFKARKKTYIKTIFSILGWLLSIGLAIYSLILK